MGTNSGTKRMGLLWRLNESVHIHTQNSDTQVSMSGRLKIQCAQEHLGFVKMQILGPLSRGPRSWAFNKLPVRNLHFELQVSTLLVVLLYHVLVYKSVLFMCL